MAGFGWFYSNFHKRVKYIALLLFCFGFFSLLRRSHALLKKNKQIEMVESYLCLKGELNTFSLRVDPVLKTLKKRAITRINVAN